MRTTTSRAAGLALALALAGLATLTAQVEDHTQIEYPPLAEFEIPRPEIFELDNGMRIFLMEDHELPLVRILARVRTGSVWEPAGKTGLAGLAGTVQRTGGTRSMTGDEIDDFLEARAASVETSIGGTVGFASMDCLKEDVDEVLPVFVEVLRYPRFAEDKLEIARVQANAGIARRNDNVNSITAREFSRLIYGGDSPLSRLEEYDTIASITTDDLAAWHARYYHPNNILLGVVGDFEPEEMKRRLRDAFGGWEPGPETELAPVAYDRERESGVYYIRKDDVTQADIRIGHLGITIDHPDYFATRVMNEVLSGGFSGRLMRSIRSTKGLSYGVGGGVGAAFLHDGVTSFRMQTKSSTMAESVDALYEEIRRMISEPATEEELQRAKETLLNSFIFNYASKDQVLGQQMLYAYYGLPADFLERYRENIEKVTAEDVARVAEAHLHPDEATLLVVGRAEDFDRPVSSFGEVVELDISIPPPTVAEEQVEMTAAAVELGRSVLNRMARAIGGESPGDDVAIQRTSKVVLSMQGQSMALTQTTIVVFPDRLYSVTATPMGERIAVIADGEGYVSMGGQSQPLPAERVEEQLSDLGRDLAYLARYHADPALEVAAAGDAEVDGTPCTEIVVRLRGAESRICVSGEGLPLRQTYRSTHPFTGVPGSFEVTLSDYREVEGRLVPHRRVTLVDGDELATSTLEAFEVDPVLAPELFEKPAA
ncbi:MAG: pitrilysin family protein [Thermoanaerobaculia bacterium]|nr:pitrilysin family protein [Thermoanaerobaculia bacterium]